MDAILTALKTSLPDLKKKRSIKIKLFSGETLSTDKVDDIEPQIDVTNIPEVVLAAFNGENSENWNEVLVFTDGWDTGRTRYENVNAFLKEQKIRLYPVIPKTGGTIKDIRISSVESNSYCRAYDRIQVGFTIHSSGYKDEGIQVVVYSADNPDKILAVENIVLNDDPVGQRSHLIFPPPGDSGEVHLVR